MSVRVLFLGKLSDLAGAERDMDAPLDWAGLLENLPAGAKALVEGEKVRLALNGTLLADKTALQAEDGSEIALLPPVSGG
ncbi:MoaD/ThiS family protein [Altericroceibacterium spongiae]|uniref:MoaD/ThiS family protein n=1 Tax=Altericroceibacterium spongiae TaxID=2320269 RepID=A0A420EJZ0_9SPHN|nr:MoaD/ThiS family protein [Altericroceibacterium spongiae]RKF20993.1 MoaD/ThiS family protein [Altericroceibacterium spongiae]